jgi:CO/xanthine dehydrogenase FAD-binding subunit
MASYLRPTTLSSALAALAERPRVILAGGTDHFPARSLRTPEEDILDITALPQLRAITATAAGWRIPALATWTDVIEADLPPLFDGLRQAAAQVGGVQVQNAGTIVGNLCNASPAADGIPTLLALDAAVELASESGRRLLPVAEFLQGSRRTARRPEELVLALHIPRPAGPARSLFLKLGARRYLVISVTMVAAVAEMCPDGRIGGAKIAVGACAPTARRLPALEAALAGRHPDPDLVLPAHLAPLAPIGDVRASAGYRMEATLELLRRAVAGLADPARRLAA